MIIQFILPMAGLAGGVKVVYQYANFLHQQGHVVRVIYPGKLFPARSSLRWRGEAALRKAKYQLDRWRGKNEAAWFPLQVPLLRTPSLESRYIPSADITIATSNETADWVARLPARCGELFYFIQGYETWSRAQAEVDATFSLPLRKIVISTLLKNIVEKRGGRVEAVVINGIDITAFYPERVKKNYQPPLTALMLSHSLEAKGVLDGLAAIQLVRQTHPELRLSMFGAEAPLPEMPAGTEYHQLPSPQELRHLYSAADIFLCPSRNEGGPLTPMEAMACGTAVVTTRVGAVPDYAIEGKTALIVPPNHPELLAVALLSLIENPKKLSHLAESGHQHIAQFSLEKAATRFAEAIGAA